MQKRGLLLSLILGVFLISFVSAQFLGRFYGGYFDESLFIYGGLFILFFALINFILGRTIFGENQATKAVISLVISLFAVYGISTSNWGISTGNFYLGGFYFGEFWPSILTILLIAGIIYFIYKWGLGSVLMVLGLLLIGISLTDLVFEKGVVLIAGIILFVIGVFLWWRRKRRLQTSGKPSGIKLCQNFGWILLVIGIILSVVGLIPLGIISIVIGVLLLLMCRRQRGISGPGPTPGPTPGLRTPGGGSRLNALITEAKKFRRWADTQKNPKFYRSWAHFLGKMGGEMKVMGNYNVSSGDIKKVVRKYII